MPNPEEIYIKKLRNSGLRPTKQRIKICEILFNREKTFHFSINELMKMIQIKINQKISLATVYNTVHAFKKRYLKEIKPETICLILILIRNRIITFMMIKQKN